MLSGGSSFLHGVVGLKAIQGPNPSKKVVHEGFRLRSTEVDRGRPKSRECLGHCLVVLMDLEARTLPKL